MHAEGLCSMSVGSEHHIPLDGASRISKLALLPSLEGHLSRLKVLNLWVMTSLES